MGLTFQIAMGPRDANCPKESSRKKRGIPTMASMMKYGMRKAPATTTTTTTYFGHNNNQLLTRTSSVLVAQIGKAPNVSETNSITDTREDELELTSPLRCNQLVLLHKFSQLFYQSHTHLFAALPLLPVFFSSQLQHVCRCELRSPKQRRLIGYCV